MVLSSVIRSISQTICWLVSQSVSQSVSRSVSHSVSHSVTQSLGQSVRQWLGQSGSYSVRQLLSQWLGQSYLMTDQLFQHNQHIIHEYLDIFQSASEIIYSYTPSPLYFLFSRILTTKTDKGLHTGWLSTLLRATTFNEFSVSGGKKVEGGGELSKNGESCAKKYEEQSLLFPAFSSPTHYCVGLHRPPAWIKVGKKRYLTLVLLFKDCHLFLQFFLLLTLVQ